MLRTCVRDMPLPRTSSWRRLSARSYATSPQSTPAPPPPTVSNTQPTLHPAQQPAVASPPTRAKNWPPSDAGIKYIFFGSLVGVPALFYVYYEYRKKHMDELRYKQLLEAQERYRQRTGQSI